MSRKLNCIAGLLSVALILSGCASDDKKDDKQSDTSSTATPDTTSDTTPDTTSDGLDTSAMVPAIQALLDLGATSSSSAPDLDACPLGDFDELLLKAPAEITDAAADGTLDAYVYQPGGEVGPPHVQCGQGNVGAYTGLVPDGDYKDDLIRVLPDFVLTFDDDVAHLGGTIVRFCADEIGVGDASFCEADWYDGNVWVGVFVDGATTASGLVDVWLVAVLADIVANVPQLAPTVQLEA